MLARVHLYLEWFWSNVDTYNHCNRHQELLHLLNSAVYNNSHHYKRRLSGNWDQRHSTNDNWPEIQANLFQWCQMYSDTYGVKSFQ